MASKIRVGIVGVNPQRGFAAAAHIPALQALPDFEIVAVCTTKQDSAEAAAKHFGIPHAFADAEKLAHHPNVDLVTVTVKVPDHFSPVMAAIAAGKHVYCEWPLGRNIDEALRMRDAAESRGISHVVGLQGRLAPEIAYARDLIAEGTIGRVLTATMITCAAGWGAAIDRAYQADFANGANLFTITAGHCLDALCFCLGEFRALSAFVVSQRDRIPLQGTGEIVAKTAPDQVIVQGIVGDGAVVSFQVRGGMARGTEFLFEIHGDKGDLSLSATARTSMQRQELKLQGGRDKDKGMKDLAIPDTYRFAPEKLDRASPYNVGQVYAKLAQSIRSGTQASPSFEAAVTRHRLLDMIVKASETGQRQTVG
jgi:predicted dehydrogenase